MPRENLAHGALYMLAAGLLFAGMGAIVKTAAQSIPNEMVVFFRCAFGLAALLPVLAHTGLASLRTRQFGRHLTRAGAGMAAMYCFFYALGQLPLAEATLLNYSTPLFVPFIAWLWLHERIPPRLPWAIALGFVGLVLILKPGLALVTPDSPIGTTTAWMHDSRDGGGRALSGTSAEEVEQCQEQLPRRGPQAIDGLIVDSLIGLAAGLFGAVAMVSIRALTRTEPAFRVVFYFSLVSTVVSAIPLLWSWRSPAPALWGWLIAMGVLASLAQLCLTRAYAHAPAAQVGPFSYATVVFAALVGWALWGEIPDALSAVGAILVAGVGILAIRLSSRRAPVVTSVAPD